jgi:hypothetical protein
VTIRIVDHAPERYVNVRKNTGSMRPVVDVPGLGTAVFIDGDELTMLQGSRYAVITVGMHPAPPDAVSNATLIQLGRIVLTRF